jgi:hypothetical protein
MGTLLSLVRRADALTQIINQSRMVALFLGHT